MSENDIAAARRALLEQYVRGKMPRNAATRERIPRRASGDVAPLSFEQQQLWLLAQLLPNPAVYNECVTVHLPGQLNIEALEQSFNEIIRRHESWRTSFPVVDGEVVQHIRSMLSLALPVVDLRSLPPAEREAEARRRAVEVAQAPFDLAHGPLLRATLMRLDDEDHRLFLCLHHIIFDGITIYQVFLPELRSLYEAFSSGQPSSLPELPIQYADFASWQRERLHEDVLEKQLAYWKKQLADAPTTLALPTDRPRPPVPTYRGAYFQFPLSRSLASALKALSRKEGVTPFMTLLAAYNILLYRYSGQEDVLIGTAAAGREHPDVQRLMGVFINTVVMRTGLQGDPSFLDLLKRVREVTLGAQEHQEVPFEYVVRALQPGRERGQNPLFQVLFMLEPAPPAHLSGWTLTHLDIDPGVAKFDLSLILEDRPEGFLCCFEYSTDLFDEETIARMAGHWQTLLESIVSQPEQRLSQLAMLTEQERRQLLLEWNKIQTSLPPTSRVHTLFEQQVERDPDAVAVIFEDEHMTYGELNRLANRLAHTLQERGVGPEVMVGLCVERSMEMVVGLLGILKAGGVYVPLDPEYPEQRLAFLLADTRMPLLLTQQRLLNRLPAYQGQVLCLDSDESLLSQQSEGNPQSAVQGEHIAYVIYTSGSTGQPKGVQIPHQAIAAHCLNVAQVYALQPRDRVLQFGTFTFDASLEQMLSALIAGAQLVVRGPEVWSPETLLKQAKALGLTVMNLPPAYWHHVLQEWARTPQRLEDSQLRLVIIGGDRLLSEALQLWRQTPLRSTRLLNAYGPTETTITASLFEVSREGEPVRTWESVPIGRPLANRTMYILDRTGNPVPVGIPGELHIGGPLLARGYLNRPELTAERFIADPFRSEPGARLYKTGDLARYRADGNIEFVGRLDQQVKIRGFRVELGEIEEALSHQPGVREAVVDVRESAPGEKSLVAYVVVAGESAANSQALRASLKQQLPAFMIPQAFVFLDHLPLLSNGKVDRQALPASEEIKRTQDESFAAPTLPIHQQLVDIWEDLLETSPIGIHDDFFALGGHSLLAARMVDRIEQVCGKRIPLSTLYAGATIAYLAEVILQDEDATRKDVQGNERAKAVVVQAGKPGKRPFFFLHGDWYGGGFYCLKLAESLDDDQPFYALEPYEFDRSQVAISFEDMAAAHIETLRAIQPEGPYLLGGFCNGGLLAYEMARQLHAAGQRVDLLVLIDPADYRSHRPMHRTFNRVGEMLRINQNIQLNWFLRYLYLRIPSYRSKVQETAPKAIKQVRNRRAVALAQWLKLDKLLPFPVELRYQWSGIYRWVSSGYIPGAYTGKLTLFWSSEGFAERIDWHALSEAHEVEDFVFPGTHMSCKNENLHILAERLNLCLKEVQSADLH